MIGANVIESNSKNARLIICMMPFILLSATTLGFALGASSPANSLQNSKHQPGNPFHSVSKTSTSLKSPPLSAAKIRSHPTTIISPAPPSSSTTSLNASKFFVEPTEKKSESKSENNIRGEHQSNIVSRLLYVYASQLLNISSKRRLEDTDALPVPVHAVMDEQVPKLEQIYQKCKAKAHKHMETLKSSSSISEVSTKRRQNDSTDNRSCHI